MADLDRWIDTLMQCKPLLESEIKTLCEMVGIGRFYVVCQIPIPILCFLAVFLFFRSL